MFLASPKPKDSQIKVAIGTIFYESGGVAKYILGIKKYSSHSISTIPPGSLRPYIAKSARAIRLYRSWLEKAKLSRYDVVHSHADPWFINLCLSSRSNTCKWVHTYHALYLAEDGNPEGIRKWHEQINRSLLDVGRKADVKISVAKWVHDYLLETHSIESEIVPNGVDLDYCDKAIPARFARKYGVGNYVLFVGYLDAVKNPRLFVELAERIPETNFVMIGLHLDAAHLKGIYEKPLPKNLFLFPELTHIEALDAISACKIFVMTSKLEGCPTVLMEAMGLKKPVVAPNHSGCKEVVHSNEYGLLYEPDSLTDLTEKTLQALGSKNIGEKARERVVKNYNLRDMVKRIDSIYECLVD